MKDKRAISTVVVTIMIVLIGIVAVVILWAALRPGIQQGAETVGEKTACIGINLEFTNPTCAGTTLTLPILTLPISRGADNAGAVQMVVVVGDTAQNAVVAPGSLGTETKTYTGVAGANVVKIAPKVGDTVCDITDTETVTC